MKTEGMICTGTEQCRSVLAMWTEKRSAEQVCRELGVTRKTLQQWEERAMDGMLRSLQPREGREEERGPALAPKVKRLLERRAMEQEGRLPRLTKRLASVGSEPESSAKGG